MIVPMKKVSFVVLEEERKEALKKLRKLQLFYKTLLTYDVKKVTIWL